MRSSPSSPNASPAVHIAAGILFWAGEIAATLVVMGLPLALIVMGAR